MSNSCIWSIDRTLSGATTPCQSGPRSDGNQGVLRIIQSSSITGTSPLGCLVLNQDTRWVLPLVQRGSRYNLQSQLTGQAHDDRSHTVLLQIVIIIKACLQHGFPELSRHPSLLVITLGKSSRRHTVSA